MIEPEFDRNGYPTEATLTAIRDWPLLDANGALDFIAAAWYLPEFGVSRELSAAEAELVNANPEDRFLRLATGGWSGNEALINAFAGILQHMFTWCLSARGGLHIFRYLPDGPRHGDT
jgi:hypothetical protein